VNGPTDQLIAAKSWLRWPCPPLVHQTISRRLPPTLIVDA